jgi:hypothetical protein
MPDTSDIERSVRETWKRAVPEIVPDPNTEALMFGAHYRLRVVSLLEAAWATVKATAAGVQAILTLDPVAFLEMTAEAVTAVIAGLQTVRQKLSAGQFLVAVALSGEHGLTRPGLAETLKLYYAIDARLFPWYLGITQELLNRARTQLYNDEQIYHILQGLVDKSLVNVDGEKYTFVDRWLDASLFSE